MEKLVKLVQTLSETRSSNLLLNIIRVGLTLTLFAKYRVETILPYSSFDFEGLTKLFLLLLIFVNIFGLYAKQVCLLISATLMILMAGHRYQFFTGSYISHHTYFVTLIFFFLGLTNSSGPLSLDNVLRKKVQSMCKYALTLIRLQITILYFWAAINKINWNYLSGFQFQQYFMNSYSGSNFSSPEWLNYFLAPLAVFTIFYELFLAIGLWHIKTRKGALISAIIFHIGLHIFLPVNVFSMIMIFSLLSFLDPDDFSNAIFGNGDSNKSHAGREQFFLRQ